MKAIVLLAAAFFAWVSSAVAQVTLELQLEQRQFLRNEVLPVYVRITNRSGQPLKIGEVADWLTFTVETREGKLISPTQDILPGGHFELESASSVTKVIDIGVGYDLGQPGSYRVTAAARFPDLKLSVNSNPQVFDIVGGARLWEEVCGLPVTNAPPQWIKYSLLQASALKQMRLYARVADEPEGNFVRVQPLGNIVSFSKPDQLIDRVSQLHVLYQNGPRSFEYCRISPRGEVVERSTHDLQSSRPRLKMSDDGKVSVVGPDIRSAPPGTVLPVPTPPSPGNGPNAKPPKS